MENRPIGQSVGQFSNLVTRKAMNLRGFQPLTLRTLTPSFQGSNPCSPAKETSVEKSAGVIFVLRQIACCIVLKKTL